MIFAFVHATLGWALAGLATFALRRRSADARCWAWRLGLLKGPLALLLAVPIVAPNLLPFGTEQGRSSAAASVPAFPPAERSLRTRGNAPSKTEPPKAVSNSGSAMSPIGNAPADRPLFRTEPTSPVALPSTVVPTKPASQPHRSLLVSASSLLSALYFAGVVAVLVFRFAAARRPLRSMPRVEGVLRPRIVVPEDLDPQGAAMARAHEEAHVRRHDPFWSLVADIVCAGLWFAPPVWLCARGMRAESEVACDAAALETTHASRKDYARLLLAHAGAAPANALGGSARRLARRILMLERTVKPVPRLAAIVLLTIGGVALIPWRAHAAPVDARTSGRRIVDLFPFRVSFEDAMLAMLNEPGVKTKIGWTPDQEAALAAREARIASIQKPSNARMAAYRQTHSQRDAFHFDYLERAKTEAALARIAGGLPLTPDQEAQLKSLTLARVGSAMWFDADVSGRLALTLTQKHSLLVRERAILDRLYRDPKLEKAYLPLPKAVSDRSVWLQYKIFTALPQDRPAFQRRQDDLLRPYRKGVPHLTADQRKAQSQARLAKGWRLLEESEPKVVALLTEAQRMTLSRLENDPSAWQVGKSGRSMRFSPAEPQARPGAGPLTGLGSSVPALRMPLERAAKLMLLEPGVKTRVGWTAAQDAAVRAGEARWQKVWDAFAAELYARHHTMTLREVFAWDTRNRGKALARADAAAEPYPWTTKQEHTLKSLALARFGSGLWQEPEVDHLLRLTATQKMAIERENTTIGAAYATAVERTTPRLRFGQPMPNEVKREIAALNRRYLDAPPALRQKLNLQIATLQNRYGASYGPDIAHWPKDRSGSLARTWTMRAVADRHLMAVLSEPQRQTLDQLSHDPDAWSAPVEVARAGDLANGGRSAIPLLAPKRAGDPMDPVPMRDGSKWKVYRDGTKLPYEYHVGRSPAPVKPRAAAATPPKGVRIASAKPIVPVTNARWYGLTIDGPPAGDEPGNVPVAVTHDPDGSTWTVYRARQSAPYTYAIEYEKPLPANWPPRMLHYDESFTSELIRHFPSIRLPKTLTVDGKVWTIHPPSRPKKDALPNGASNKGNRRASASPTLEMQP